MCQFGYLHAWLLATLKMQKSFFFLSPTQLNTEQEGQLDVVWELLRKDRK